MGKERLSSAQRVTIRGTFRGSRGSGRGTGAIQERGGPGRVGDRQGDLGVNVGEARDADGLGWAAPPQPPLPTSTTAATAHANTNTGSTTTTASANTRAAKGEHSAGTSEVGRGYFRDQEKESLGSGLDAKESWTVEREGYDYNTPGGQFDTNTSIPNATHPTAPTRSYNHSHARGRGGENTQPQPPLPRQSPDPHPQPKRYVLKFKRQLLEKSQAKEAAQREVIEALLERQRGEAVCVSSLVRERDLEIMPSLEGALSLRSGKPRGGGAGAVSGAEKGRAVNGNGNGRSINGNGGMNGVERERAVRGPGRRPRDKENKLNGHGIHVEEVPPPAKLNTTITISEPTKPPRPKKMELELRIDDNSKDKDKETLERNIDNVIFGEVTFKAWYPSWYPKEIIGEKALTVGAGDKGGIVVTELYVCKRCFGYGKVLVEWVRHCRCCEREVPGRKVYVHGGWREDDTPRPAVGEWSIWEVDGGVETLFCQNLSLFAKLFLDNKSVFFDVSGFNYFLLVYTPPQNSPHNTTNPSQPPQKQVIGFFSKEKLSWDNNNLACILIFPPWQRKGLGALLMGVSYAIARREQILGGPEKPISDLGRKGYKRFWGAEIARWILERPDDRKKKGKGKGKREEVGIKLLSEETWIAQEDCLGVLRDMD
ncbi:acyl-CoA N-acyltransferase, partial [Leptodontidium sp. 2 PMI_412]